MHKRRQKTDSQPKGTHLLDHALYVGERGPKGRSEIVRLCMFFAVVLFATTLSAQRPAATRSAPMGLLTGHVYLADSNAPARFATVVIEPAREIDNTQSDEKDQGIHAVSAQTLLDGTFLMPKVAPGAYYVMASAPGYVSAFAALGESLASLQNPDKALREKIGKLIPRVTVQANLPSSIDIRLERGATISGDVRYDDGSFASGLQVHLLMRQKKAKDQKEGWEPVAVNGFLNTPRAETDDQGSYRLCGLPAGEYLVQIDLSLTVTQYNMSHNGSGTAVDLQYSLPVFSGGAFRPKDGTSLGLKLGDQRAGEDIQVPLSKIHSVSGMILAARDGHIVNSGSIALLNADDQSEVATTKLSKDSTTFAFSFVPEGDYLLRATGAKDVDFEEVFFPPGTSPVSYIKEHPLHMYGAADLPIHVGGDTSGLTLAVPETAASPAVQSTH